MTASAALPNRANVLVLSAAQALGASGAPVIVSLGGLVGTAIAPSPLLATVPVSMYTIGVALGTLPVAYMIRRFGRRETYLTGVTMAVLAGLTAMMGVLYGSFVLFCLGTALAGLYGASVQSYRFAATDGLPAKLKPRAVSSVMVGGLVAAVIGPQLVIFTINLIPDHIYAGSFLSQAAMAVLAIPILWLLRPAAPKSEHVVVAKARPFSEIARQPRFRIALVTGLISYSMMSFMMTSAPLAMVGCGYSVGDAALGIQWHILAMFGPSFITGRLISRFGTLPIAVAGLSMIALAAISAIAGLTIWNFWGALVLLGVGWNFSFIGATTMVTECHTPEEASTVQGVNDFVVFGSVAVSSVGSGVLINVLGWGVLNGCLLVVAAGSALGLLLLRSKNTLERPQAAAHL